MFFVLRFILALFLYFVNLCFFSLCLVFVPFLYYVTLRGGWSGKRFVQTSILPQSVGGHLQESVGRFRL